MKEFPDFDVIPVVEEDAPDTALQSGSPGNDGVSRVPENRRLNVSPTGKIEDPVLFDQIVMVPFRLRELRGDDSRKKTETPPLDRWVERLTDGGESNNGWKRKELFFPFHHGVTKEHRNRAYDRIRYAEYVYFHPFVRAFANRHLSTARQACRNVPVRDTHRDSDR